jgi:hypothetical protein
MADPLEDARHKQLITAILTAGICGSRDGVSVEAMLQIQTDVHNSMFPDPNSGAYKTWKEARGG